MESVIAYANNGLEHGGVLQLKRCSSSNDHLGVASKGDILHRFHLLYCLVLRIFTMLTPLCSIHDMWVDGGEGAVTKLTSLYRLKER